MSWQRQFRAAFFDAWTSEHLAPPLGAPSYAEGLEPDVLRAARALSRTPAVPVTEADPLDPGLLESVLGFGVMVGTVCGELLGLPHDRARSRASWCGRFNLGISLFDYVCDESTRAEVVLALPSFHRFSAGPRSREGDAIVPRPVEDLLDRIAGEVLQELDQELVRRGSGERHDLWRALRRMFRAEQVAARTGLGERTDLILMRRALRLKSAEPFRVMAEWMAWDGSSSERSVRTGYARRLGRALGTCYWLVDDAKDVWRDLDAGRWNLFLIRAAEEEPALFDLHRNVLVDHRLTTLWERSAVAERESGAAVRKLARALAEAPVPAETRQRATSAIAASLASW